MSTSHMWVLVIKFKAFLKLLKYKMFKKYQKNLEIIRFKYWRAVIFGSSTSIWQGPYLGIPQSANVAQKFLQLA